MDLVDGYKIFIDTMLSHIKEVFPFKNKKEFLEFEKKFKVAGKNSMKIKNDNDFLVYLKSFLAGLRHSHLRVSGYPWQSFHPRNYEVVFIKGEFLLKNKNNIIGEILSVDGIKPKTILNQAIKSITGSTRQYLISQGLKFILLNREEKPAVLELKLGNKKFIRKLSRKPIENKQKGKNIEAKIINKNIGYFKIKFWLNDDINKNYLENKINYFYKNKIKSLIIDVRGNNGGSSQLADVLASHFFNKKVLFGTNKRRISKNNFKLKKFYYHIYPKEPYFNIPIYILIDSQSFSSTELFVAGMKDNKRATLIGEITGGGTGNSQKILIQFKNYPFNLFVPTWIYYRPNGKEIEGIGIKPDIVTKKSIGFIYKNIDEALMIILRKFKKTGKKLS